MGFKSGSDKLTQLEVESSAASEPVVTIKNTNAGTTAGSLRFTKDGASAADDDVLGAVDFYGEDSTAASTQYVNIEAISADITDGAENGTLNFKAKNGGTLYTLATLNPKSYTADTFCGGFGYKNPVFGPGADGTLTADMSGCIVVMSPGDDVKLPAPQPGLWYRFVAIAAHTSGASTITSTSDGSTAVNLFFGIVETNGAPTSTADKDVISFTTSATEGDWVEVFCVSSVTTANNNTWWYKAYGDAAGAITVA